MSKQYDYEVPQRHILHGGMSNATLRAWNSPNTDITAKNFMYPLFIVEQNDALQPIPSMPGINRYGLNKLQTHLDPLVKKGLTAVLLFGVPDKLSKDENASKADSSDNPVIRAVKSLSLWYPNLTIACDVCLCGYTSHGHCGILDTAGVIDNAKSVKRISEVALAYAKAGAHIVAPSDMMDGRIGAIKHVLINNGLGNKVAVLSYSTKFASTLYGPFRDAANSAPSFGDRKCYQLPPGSRGLALRAAERDVREGADFLMVKPVMFYMDILRELKIKYPEYSMFVYQTSGEYSMIYKAAKEGTFDLKAALTENLVSLRRSGADVIISYFTPVILDWLQEEMKSKI